MSFAALFVMRGIHLAATNHKHSVNNPYAQSLMGCDKAAILSSPLSLTSSPHRVHVQSNLCCVPHLSLIPLRCYDMLYIRCSYLLYRMDLHAVSSPTRHSPTATSWRTIELVLAGLVTDYPDAFIGHSAMDTVGYGTRSLTFAKVGGKHVVNSSGERESKG